MNQLESRDALIPQRIAETIVDPAAYADGSIYDAFKWLRKNNPLGQAKLDGFDPFWVVTRHEDILRIGRDNTRFRSGDRQITVMDQASERRSRELSGGKPYFTLSVVLVDPPLHTQLRNVTSSWFMPANVRKLEEHIRLIAKAFIERMSAMNGECDFAKDIALLYPLRVIMSILGVPEADESLMLKLTQELFGPQDPDVTGAAQSLSKEQQADFMHAAIQGFDDYFRRIGEDRRRNPQDDLASTIANATVDGAPISEAAELGYYTTVATAGHDTTSASTATALWELAKHPELLSALKANPSLINNFVDEAIRYATPIKHFMRSAAVDVDIGGRHFHQGDWLMLCYASGNRDEAIFDEPDKFSLDRVKNPHIAFGWGPHMCLGQHLARMEIRIFFEELIPKLESLALNGEAKCTKAIFISVPKAVPIRFAF
jgi:cytochrome P450